jgi:hypothetical protein
MDCKCATNEDPVQLLPAEEVNSTPREMKDDQRINEKLHYDTFALFGTMWHKPGFELAFVNLICKTITVSIQFSYIHTKHNILKALDNKHGFQMKFANAVSKSIASSHIWPKSATARKLSYIVRCVLWMLAFSSGGHWLALQAGLELKNLHVDWRIKHH